MEREGREGWEGHRGKWWQILFRMKPNNNSSNATLSGVEIEDDKDDDGSAVFASATRACAFLTCSPTIKYFSVIQYFRIIISQDFRKHLQYYHRFRFFFFLLACVLCLLSLACSAKCSPVALHWAAATTTTSPTVSSLAVNMGGRNWHRWLCNAEIGKQSHSNENCAKCGWQTCENMRKVKSSGDEDVRLAKWGWARVQEKGTKKYLKIREAEAEFLAEVVLYYDE